MNESQLITVSVGTVGKAHGLKGEVSLILRTDVPEDRLYQGAQLEVAEASYEIPTVTVEKTRIQQGRWYVKFAEIVDRTAAEKFRGATLNVTLNRDEEFAEDPDAWYPEELKGLAVKTPTGEVLGKVLDLQNYPAHDVLLVRAVSGEKVMLPFVEEFVPEIDLDAQEVIATPPGGLFDPHNADSERDGKNG